ncbi:MAG: hypothetical protein RIS36_662 [Pseudomonadota bacterium]
MESVGAKSYRQRSSDTVGFEAPAPHIVVVCPSCKTSFAVETAAVAALEIPRFHCSRCDDIFIMKDAPASMLPLGGVNLQSLIHSAHVHRGAHSRERRPLPESLIKPSDFSLGANTTTSKAFIEPNFNIPYEPPVETRSELSLLSRGAENTHVEQPTIEEEVTCEAPVATHTPVAATSERIISEEVSQASSFVVTPAAAQAPTLSSRQFVLADPPPLLPDHALTQSRAKTQLPTAAQPSSVATEAPPKARSVSDTESYRPTPQPRRADTQSAPLSQPRRFSARIQSLTTMGAPVLGSLALLLGFSYCAQVSPQSVDALMNYVTPSAFKESVQTLPPSSLGVKNLRISFKKTRNREFIPVVTGTVLNESGRSFEDVELEVIGFNGRGEMIASSRAPLRSDLGNENISDLSLETIVSYQKALAAKDSSIKAREAVPFTIALLNGRQIDEEIGPADFDPSHVKYFSARIFAVKRPK